MVLVSIAPTSRAVMPELRPLEVIAGASIPDQPNAYVLGCYDTRITLYSQQVRALELAHALLQAHYVTGNTHAAVVGGGAGGLAMAAALALQGAAAVHLFERGPELMPLQSNARRRRLDPHIYNWPDAGADNEEAELPILDWKSGAATEVRSSIVQGFGSVSLAVGDRLIAHPSSRVVSVAEAGRAYQICYERDDGAGSLCLEGLNVDLIVLAFGFGLEPTRSIPGVRTESYWRDAGVPGGDIAGRARPGVAVSGNGDGGLIDLVAAASRDFSHDDMIRMIIGRPGIERLFEPLASIDARAREEDAIGRGFDFPSAYDVAIGGLVDDLGLTGEVARKLTPGIRIYIQTREPELMSARTATLNRLAVYLVRRACERVSGCSFEHIVCRDLTLLDAGPALDQPAYTLDCGGRRIEVDTLVIRRGPGRDEARQPFANLLRDYAAAHEAWTRRFPIEAIAPVLSDAARRHFARLARQHQLPSAVHRRASEAAGAARRIKVAMRDGQARWTGDVALADIATAWDSAGPAIALTLAAPPSEFRSLAHAFARLALHAPGCTMQGDVVRWGPFLDGVTVDSAHAEDLERPILLPFDGSSDLRPEQYPLDQMAHLLGEALDRRCLSMIDEHMAGLLDRGADPGHVADLAPASGVADAMRMAWTDWKASFDRDPVLLSRFLRLLVCAQDGTATASEARVLVGPRKRKLLIRATAAALAVAAGWRGTSPHPAEPGNLTTEDATGHAVRARTGHVCAAERIAGRPTSTEAAGFLWGTDFVILPMLTSPVAVAIRAEERLDAIEGAEPTLAMTGGQPSLMLSLDPRFKEAVGTGVADISQLLSEIETTHQAQHAGRIEKAGSEDAPGARLEDAA